MSIVMGYEQLRSRKRFDGESEYQHWLPDSDAIRRIREPLVVISFWFADIADRVALVNAEFKLAIRKPLWQ